MTRTHTLEGGITRGSMAGDSEQALPEHTPDSGQPFLIGVSGGTASGKVSVPPMLGLVVAGGQVAGYHGGAGWMVSAAVTTDACSPRRRQ